MESIQSLLILSLWPPVYGLAESNFQDGRVLIASAVSMAMNLRLNEASAKVMIVHDTPGQDASTLNAIATDSENIEKARLVRALSSLDLK